MFPICVPSEYEDGSKHSYAYDEAGNRISSIDRLGNESSWKYDSVGRIVEEVRPGGLITTRSYDENGDMVLRQDNAGHRTEWLYDKRHNVLCVKEQTESGEPDKTISCHFFYDKAGRLLAQEDSCGRTEYGYNARNKRTLVRDGEGNEFRWLYDGMGRLLAMYPPKAWKKLILPIR